LRLGCAMYQSVQSGKLVATIEKAALHNTRIFRSDRLIRKIVLHLQNSFYSTTRSLKLGTYAEISIIWSVVQCSNSRPPSSRSNLEAVSIDLTMTLKELKGTVTTLQDVSRMLNPLHRGSFSRFCSLVWLDLQPR
jgi:hypothetical protein